MRNECCSLYPRDKRAFNHKARGLLCMCINVNQTVIYCIRAVKCAEEDA